MKQFSFSFLDQIRLKEKHEEMIEWISREQMGISVLIIVKRQQEFRSISW